MKGGLGAYRSGSVLHLQAPLSNPAYGLPMRQSYTAISIDQQAAGNNDEVGDKPIKVPVFQLSAGPCKQAVSCKQMVVPGIFHTTSSTALTILTAR